MKNIKKLLAILLVLTMALSLAACGFEAKMARAAKKMEKLESYRMDMDLDMAMSMSLMGQSMDLDIGMQGKADVNTKPLVMKMDMDMTTMGESIHMLSYAEKTDAGYITYVSPDGGDTWVKQTLDGGQLPEAGAATNFALLFKLVGKFEKTGTETIRGSEATVFSGTVEGEDIAQMVEMSGVMDTLSESMDVDLGELNVELESLGGIPTTISLDNKTGYIVRYTMDMTELMQNLMPVLMDQLMATIAEESGLEGLDLSMLGLKLDVSKTVVAVELYDFDAAGTVEIPAEARAAEELSDLAA